MTRIPFLARLRPGRGGYAPARRPELGSYGDGDCPRPAGMAARLLTDPQTSGGLLVACAPSAPSIRAASKRRAIPARASSGPSSGGPVVRYQPDPALFQFHRIR